MNLKQRLQADLKQALKNRETDKLSLLRMLLSAVNYAQIDTKGEMTEEAIITVLRREAKKRREAIEAYQQAGRLKAAEKETQELALIETYLPQQMKPEQIEAQVKSLLKDKSGLDFGRAMGLVMKELKGKADGRLVNQAVRTYLSKTTG